MTDTNELSKRLDDHITGSAFREQQINNMNRKLDELMKSLNEHMIDETEYLDKKIDARMDVHLKYLDDKFDGLEAVLGELNEFHKKLVYSAVGILGTGILTVFYYIETIHQVVSKLLGL